MKLLFYRFFQNSQKFLKNQNLEFVTQSFFFLNGENKLKLANLKIDTNWHFMSLGRCLHAKKIMDIWKYIICKFNRPFSIFFF